MHNKVIKIDDNNFFKAKINIYALPSKSKIEKYSYLPRINLCELVMKLNNDCQCSVNLFTIYCAELNND